MSIWNLNVNCGITFGEDSRLTVGEKLKSYGATTALLLYDMAMDQFGYQREIEKVINDANIKVVCYQVEEGEPTAQKSDRAYDFAKGNRRHRRGQHHGHRQNGGKTLGERR